ncbi:uncharacterized protein PRCAT00005488001 [Priceomyces carsonii]|uniref:uncharacterized protein n=1 Tax=Priceomyces carsonii TaxID=28549 RepID=UPI002ED8A6A5|nr:unnamed protein product [Priceomyces carsonii]
MSPTSTKEFNVEGFLSKKATTKNIPSFRSAGSINEPKGFKAHLQPLALSYGVPDPAFFPIRRITIDVDEYPFQDTLFANEEEKGGSIVITKDEEELLGLSVALQYGEVAGASKFKEFLKDFVQIVHDPGYKNWSVLSTNGSSEGLNKVMETIINPGDTVLMEEFTFTPICSTVKNVGGIPVPVKFDLDKPKPDIDVEYLTELLENWDELKPEFKGRKPKAFYTIPTAQNPVGSTQSVETRQKIYELSIIHDFLIVEDDPYHYLTLPPLKDPSVENIKDDSITVEEYLSHTLTPSYLKFDTHGRVIRVESFSKVFAPGLRLGFIVAHQRLIAALDLYSSLSTRAPSGASQSILLNVIVKKFGGIHGYLGWILKMRLAYGHRRNVLIATLNKSEAKKKNYLTVKSCEAGMFASVAINLPPGVSVADKMVLLDYKFLQFGVQVVLGERMAVDPLFSEKHSNFIRITFASLSTDEELKEAGTRFGNAVEAFFENGLEY